MARLPVPGGDNGKWGAVLNDYLAQSHNSDGTLKSNSVGPAQLQPDAVTAAQIADGSIEESLLDNAVQAKLNQATPTWATLVGKPLIIAAGNDAATARNAIGLDDGLGKIPKPLIPAMSGTDIAGLSDRFAAWSSADAYIDFTTKPDGDPPSVLDTGQHVDFISEAQSGWKPQVVGGQLVHGTLPGSGPYAAYYQAQLDGNCYKAGVRWVIDDNDGSTNASMCLAAWTSIYEPPSNAVPKSPYHITVSTLSTSNNVSFWVTDGGGSGADHLTSIKSWTCTLPATDGQDVWELSVLVDPDTGTATLKLPGIDSISGSCYVTLSESEINGVLMSQGLPAVTFSQLLDGADVVMVEHYAHTNANTAVYPRFLDMWGEVARPARKASFEMDSQVKTNIATLPKYARYGASQAANTTVPNSLSPVPGLPTITFTTPIGCTAVEVEATLYYTVSSGPSRIIMNFSEGVTSYDTRTVLNTAPYTGEVRYTGYRDNLIPGTTHTITLNHMVASGSAVTLNSDNANGYIASWKVTPVIGE